jgi:hypothetical protein
MRPITHVAINSTSPACGSLALVLALCGLVVSACNGPASSLTPAREFAQRSQGINPSSASSPTPSPIPFVYQTVDNPNSLKNQVNGINQLSKIVGTYGAGQSSSMPESYTSQSPFSKFRSLNEPGSQGTVATSLSSNRIDGGYVISPNNLNGVWGFVRIDGVFTLLDDPSEGSDQNAVTEILGLNDKKFAVGFYLNRSGNQVPFELNITKEKFTDLNPPGASNAEATGINDRGDILGWDATSGGIKGFFVQTGTYYPFSAAGAQATYGLSINYDEKVAGYYVDAQGATHGFVMTGPNWGGKAQVWQTIDEPNAAAGTWLTGINNHDDICGYYVDGSGIQHGFVAVPGR